MTKINSYGVVDRMMRSAGVRGLHVSIQSDDIKSRFSFTLDFWNVAVRIFAHLAT